VLCSNASGKFNDKRSFGLDCNFLFRPLSLRRLRQCHRQHAFLEAGVNLIEVDSIGYLERALTPQELAEAQAWVANDEALINTGRPLPTGRVGQLIEIIRAKEQEDEQQ
jgi:hypothetical protein